MIFIEKASILNQFKNPDWLKNSGVEPEQLKMQCRIIATANAPRNILKSQIFECILENAQISICYDDLFVDQINHCGIMQEIRESWKKNAFKKAFFPEPTIRAADCFAYTADEDFGHVAPDWEAILQLGIPGILERLEKFQIENEANHALNLAQTAFYAFGKLLIGTLQNAGIDTNGLVEADDVFTTLAFVTLDEHGDREFSFS